MNIIFDMETQDPDDVLTLCFLCGHPSVRIRAVTINPGSQHQVALVKEVLKRCEVDVPIGSRDPDYPKNCVSAFHWKVIDRPDPVSPTDYGHKVLAATLTLYPDATIVTGAPMTNLRFLLEKHPTRIQRWVGQGGFVGSNIIPPEQQLEKFAGKEFVQTFNFGGDRRAAELMLTAPQVEQRFLVGKNVCHSVKYDKEFHERTAVPMREHPAHRFLRYIMEVYLQKKPYKMLHDPLAACVAVNPDICKFVEVRYKYDRGKWGADLAERTNTWGAVSVNHEKFFQTFVGSEFA